MALLGSTKIKRNSNSDDYGFLPLRRTDSSIKQPRITVTVGVNPSQSQVDYFDESLFDIGYVQTGGQKDSIPVTLGSVSSVISNRTDSVTDSSADSASKMPIYVPPLPDFCQPKRQQESHYVNSNAVSKNSSTFYRERKEGHYARLTEVNIHKGQPKSAAVNVDNSTNGLNFYVQKAAEQRVRSRSRGPADRSNRGRSRSARSRQGNTPRSRSRGCSASREIMALYTNRPVSACRLRDSSVSPDRDSTSHLRRRQSISPDSQKGNRSGQLHHNSNNSTVKHKNQSTASNKSPRTDSGNRFSKSDNSQQKKGLRGSPPKPPRLDSNDGSSFMTLLEMDVEKNAQIEKDLLAANSLKPANIKMMMIAHHAPSSSWASKDEVPVKAGDIVTGIYKQNEWLFIMTDTREVGFVPYAFTKSVKVTTNSANHTNTVVAPLTKPVNGILKTANHGKQRSRKSHPKYSVKVRTAADNDSLSSESSSAILDDFVYTRQKSNSTQNHADCIVVDTDDICSSYDSPLSPHNREETGTYCSDSGISDPSSNHSEDLDFLHSPISCISEEHNDSGLSVPISTPRLPNERIVSVTTELLANSPHVSAKTDSHSKGRRYHGSDTISDLPLGPLGARLAKINLENSKGTKSNNDSRTSKLGYDTRERARSSGTTPSTLRPEIPKDYNGPRVTVVFDYDGDNEDDVSVHASDIVTVLNSEDIEWIWVQRRDGKEGFMPREYVIPLELAAQNRRRIGISLL